MDKTAWLTIAIIYVLMGFVLYMQDAKNDKHYDKVGKTQATIVAEVSDLYKSLDDHANRIDGLNKATQLTDHLLGQDLDALKARVEKLEKLHNKKLQTAECIRGQK
jgi:hypothetical protein